MAGVSSPGAISIANHVRKTSVAVPAPVYYPAKTIPSAPPSAPVQTLSRPTVVPKTSTTSSQPQPAEHVIEGRNISATYEATHSRVVPPASIDESAGHHRVYIDDQRAVHGEFRAVNMHPRYPNPRFLEPPRVDVTRLTGSSPSTPSPAGRPLETEPPHALPHQSSMPPGYDVVSTLLPLFKFDFKRLGFFFFLYIRKDLVSGVCL